MYLLVICAALISSAISAEVPTCISRCCGSSADSNNCMLKEANRLISYLVIGDNKYNFINLMPYQEASRVLLNSEDGKFILYSVEMYGLDSTQVTYVNVNFKTGTAVFKYHFYRLKILFSYYINIFDTPLFGVSSGDITLSDVKLVHSYSFATDKDDYVFLKNEVVSYTAGKMAYNLQNLDVDAAEYFDDNYKLLDDLFQPNIRRFLRAAITMPFRAIGELTKLSDILYFGSACNRTNI